MAPPKQRRGSMSALASLVTKVYPGDKAREIQSARIFSWWYRAVPPRLAEHARPVRLVKGVLWIHTSNSSWSQHLQFLRDQLLASVQKFAPPQAVRDLRFRVGPLPPPVQVPRAPELPPVLPLEKLPEEVALALAHVRDDSLRDALMQAARVALAPKPELPKQDLREVKS